MAFHAIEKSSRVPDCSNRNQRVEQVSPGFHAVSVRLSPISWSTQSSSNKGTAHPRYSTKRLGLEVASAHEGRHKMLLRNHSSKTSQVRTVGRVANTGSIEFRKDDTQMFHPTARQYFSSNGALAQISVDFCRMCAA